MKHILRVPGLLEEYEPMVESAINFASDRHGALKLGKEMALYHDKEVHVYELVKILKPVTTVELNDPPTEVEAGSDRGDNHEA